MTNSQNPNSDLLCRKIMDLVAMRGYKRDHDHNEVILDCVEKLLVNAGYGRFTDVL